MASASSCWVYPAALRNEARRLPKKAAPRLPAHSASGFASPPVAAPPGLEITVGGHTPPPVLDARPTTQIRAGCAGPDPAAKENMRSVKLKTASGVFTWDRQLHQGKIVRKLRTALGKTGRVTTKGVRHSVPGPVL